MFAWFLSLGWLSQPDSWCENANPSPDNQKGAVKVACCLLIQIRWHLICQFSHQLHIWQVVSIATNNIYSVIGLWNSPIKIWCTLGYSFEIYFPKFVCWERIYFADELLPLFSAERTLCWKGHLKIQRKI